MANTGFTDTRTDEQLLESPKVPKAISYVKTVPKLARIIGGIATGATAKLAALALSSGLGAVIEEETDPNKLRRPIRSGPSLDAAARGLPLAETVSKYILLGLITNVPVAKGVPAAFGVFRHDTDLRASAYYKVVGGVNRLFKRGDVPQSSGNISEPPPAYAPQYPHNNVEATPSGHLIEKDDTPGAERLHFYHRTGTREEYRPDGGKVDKVVKDRYTITMGDDHVIIQGDAIVTVQGGIKLYVKSGMLEIQCDNAAAVNVKGDLSIHANNISLNAKRTIDLSAPVVKFGNPTYVTLPTDVKNILGVPVVHTGTLVTPATGTIPVIASQVNIATMAGLVVSDVTIPVEESAPDADEPEELAISNPRVYESQAPEAVDQRTRMFDSPDETVDVEAYSAHIELSHDLGDFAREDKNLTGELVSSLSDTDSPATEPSVTSLDWANYVNRFTLSANTTFGTTGVPLRNLMPSPTLIPPTETT